MPLGLGLAAIGRPKYINLRNDGPVRDAHFELAEFRRQGIRLLNAAYDAGVRDYDAAPGYGMAESMLLEWLSIRKDPEIRISTKWGYTYTADFHPYPTRHEIKEHSLEKLREQWSFSRQLLPQLGVYQIHSATLESGVLTDAAVLDELARIRTDYEGLQIGLSATGPQQLAVVQAAQQIMRDGRPLFTCFQFTFNILEQSILSLVESLLEGGYRLMVKEALANGRLIPRADYPGYATQYETINTLAAKYGVGPDAIALRYALDQIPTAVVLSGAVTEDQLFANLQAEKIRLNSEDKASLMSLHVDPGAYWEERRRLPWN